VRVGSRRSRAASVTPKAMEGLEILDCSPEGPPGVWDSERSESGGRNWGGPPGPARPDGSGCGRSLASYNRCSAGKWMSCREGVGGDRSTA